MRKLFNLMFNMYSFFTVIELISSNFSKLPFSIEKVLLYSFCAHIIGLIMMIVNGSKEISDKNKI